jgi:DNA-binding transcriptional MerR regulator
LVTYRACVADKLVPTGEAARQLGISPRTIARYVARGWVVPDLTLPSGQYRWDVARLRDQINNLARPTET